MKINFGVDSFIWTENFSENGTTSRKRTHKIDKF